MIYFNLGNTFETPVGMCMWQIKTLLFPDNQPHVQILNTDLLECRSNEDVTVFAPLRNSVEVMNLLQLSDAISALNLGLKKKVLVIPYLMGARFDRIMQTGDSLDLRVIGRLINSCGFEKVMLLDVHSDAAMLAIDNAVNVSNRVLVQSYQKEDAVLICPDAGAAKKMSQYLKWNNNIREIVYVNKKRDVTNGNLTIDFPDAHKCFGRNCVIVDDICDGGGTFLGIAQHLGAKAQHVTLIATHGIFSQGVQKLMSEFDLVLTTDSYNINNLHERIKVTPYIYCMRDYLT